MYKPKPNRNSAHPGLPRWEEKGATYFASFNLREDIKHFVDEEKQIVFDVVLEGRTLYDLFALVVMPNHVHLILKPKVSEEEITLPRAMQHVKGVSSYRVNKHRGSSGPIWEPRSHTRIVRNEKELYEEMKYIANNPVVPGIVKRPDEYPFLWYFGKDRKRD